jgi:hypothetical protein
MTIQNSELDGDDATQLNLDPITGTPGAHPVGTGFGATAGGIAAGAAAGTFAGPLGTVVGAVVGAIAGGLAGKGIAEMIDPTAEEAYWRDNYSSRPYVGSGASFDDYGPAYRYGIDSFGMFEGHTFEDAEPELKRDWDGAKGGSSLTWDYAKNATRDSWQHISAAAASRS